MKTILIILFSNLLFLSFASSEKGIYLTYKIDSIKADKSLIQNEAAFEFTFYNTSKSEEMRTIIYSVNGVQSTSKMNSKDQIRIKEVPGKYAFQFFYTEWHSEIYTDSISAISNHTTYVSIFFHDMNTQIMVDKPIIYLYPSEPLTVIVKVVPKGEFTFTYPTYQNGWTVQADPSGELTINEKKYNYLFWESSQKADFSALNVHEGFVIKKDETIAFLESKLTEFGLNSKEQTDFITFWGPQLMKNNKNFIHFEFNEGCNQFAELNISPKPDAVYRLYILSIPLSENESLECTPQIIPRMNRSGFVVFEWGGSQLTRTKINLTSN